MPPENPYDPNPQPPSPPPLPPPTIPGVFGGLAGESGYLPVYSFEASWERGWRVFKEHYAVLLAAAAIIMGASIVDSCVQRVLELIHGALPFVWAVPFMFGVSLPLNAGAMLIAARAARGRRAQINDLFLGYRRIGSIIIWSVLVGAVCIVGVIPGGAVVLGAYFAGGDQIAVLVAIPVVLIYMVAMLCLSTRFYYVPTMFADPELPPQEILATAKASWNMTKGIWPSLLGLSIVCGLLMFASIFVLCVGVIFIGYPIMLAVMGAAYALVVNPIVRPGRNCSVCGYNFTGLPPEAPCPECGAQPSMSTPPV